MTVQEMFERYNLNVVVRENLSIELKYMPYEDVIALQLHASVLSHIPRSETNKIYQPTEDAVLKKKMVNNTAVNAMNRITKEIEQVENLVNSLSDEEKFVTVEKYINCHSWKEIEQITEKNGTYWTRTTLKIYKKRADIKMQKAINELLDIGKFIMVESEGK
jgi:homoserine dehydrogenase